MANEWESPRVLMLLKLKSFLPKSHLIYHIFLIFKLLPIIILTHDWNINYGYGISAILSEITLGPIISKIKDQMITVWIIIIIIACSLLLFITIIIGKCRLANKQPLLKGWRIIIYICALFMFFILFLPSQQIYSMIIENLFAEPKFNNNLLYKQIASIVFGNNMNIIFFYVFIGFQVILIVFCIFVGYLISIVFFEPFYSTQVLLTSGIGEIDWQWLFFSLCQGINQLEYHLPFTYIIYIKASCRGLYIIYYIKWFIDQRHTFYSNHVIQLLINLSLSMCFISCLIEFIFLYDYKNDLILLTSNVNFVVMKLFIELILGASILAIIQQKEISFVTVVDPSKNKNALPIYSCFNRLFYYISDPTIMRNLTMKIFNVFYTEFNEHQKQCKNKSTICYCQEYHPETFFQQSFNFFFVYDNQKIKVSHDKKNLKEHFPSFYNFIEQTLIEGINKNYNGIILNQYFLLCVLFYLEFDKNITKAFYFLEEFMKSQQYKKSAVVQVQVRMIRNHLKTKFYSMMQKSSDLSLKKHYHDFKNILHYNQIERSIRTAFDGYYEFLCKSSIQGMRQEEFFDCMKTLSKTIEIDKELFIHYFENEKCNHLNLCAELTLYYRFFYHDVPHNIASCFKELKKMEELIKYESNKQIILTFSNAQNSHFKIEYVSDALIQDLNYSNTNELTKRFFNEITIPTFAASYDAYLKDEVHKGNTSLCLPHLCLIDSQMMILMYSLKAIVIIMGNTLKVFGTFISFDDQKLKEYNQHKAKGKEKKIKTCYSLVTKSGRIIGVNDEFQKFFLINMKLIAKLKINIFRDILKITHKNNKQNYYAKPTDVYANLLELHEGQMLENNQKEYVQIYHNGKDILNKLQKHPVIQHFIFNLEEMTLEVKGKKKEYSIIYLSIEGEKKKSMHSFEKYIMKNKLNAHVQTYNSLKKYNIPLVFQFEQDQSDIMEKLTLIKLQALKVLFSISGISGNIIKPFIEKKIELDKDDSENNKHNFVEQRETIFSLNNKEINRKLNIKRSLIFQFILFIIFLLFFCGVVIGITLYEHFLYTKGETIMYSALFFQMAKRQLSAIISLAINMQLKANGVYNETMDNDFPNKSEDLQEALLLSINDYKEFIKKFKDYFQSLNLFTNAASGFVGDLSNSSHPAIMLDPKLKSAQVNFTLSESLSSLHYRVSRIVDKGFLTPLLFNNTDPVTKINSYFPQYFIDNPEFDSIGSDEFIAEDSSVFIIENILTTMRYPYIEGLNQIDGLTITHANSSQKLILILCLLNSCILFSLFVYQIFYYYFLNQKIFAKAFINFCYLQYFNFILLKKTQLLKEFMEIATIETTVKMIITRTNIKNKDDESALIASKTEQIDSDFLFEINPFEVTTEEINLLETYGQFTSNNNSNLNATSDSMSALGSSEKKTPLQSRKSIKAAYLKQTQSSSIIPKQTNEKKVSRIKNQAVSILKMILKKSLQKATSIKSTEFARQSIIMNMHRNSQTNNIFLGNSSSQQQIQPINSVNNIIVTNADNNNSTTTTTGNLNVNSHQMNKQQQQQQTPENMFLGKQEAVLKRGNIIVTLLLFFCFCLYAFIVSITYYFISFTEFKLIQNYSKVQFQTLVRLDCFHELLAGIQVSIMKNTPLVYDYISNGLLKNNTVTLHEIVIDQLNDFKFFDKQFRLNVIDEPQFVFKKIVEFDEIIRSPEFCEKTAEMISQHTFGDFQFSRLNKLTKEDYLYHCNTIGNGFNKNGFYTAILSLINYASDTYQAFSRQPNRNKDYNYEKLNEKSLQVMYAETYYILEFVMIKYQQVLTEEYTYNHANIRLYSNVYIIVVVLCVVILAWIYELKLMKKHLVDINALEKVEILVYHTVVF